MYLCLCCKNTQFFSSAQHLFRIKFASLYGRGACKSREKAYVYMCHSAIVNMVFGPHKYHIYES